MTKFNNGLQMSINEAYNWISAVGDEVTVILRSAPGQGKSHMLYRFQQDFPEYRCRTLDVTTLELGDTAMPVIDRERMVVEYATNAIFGLERNSDTPVVLNVDELGKGTKPVRNMLMPLLLEHRIGDRFLPRGSKVFGSTNLATDGVGDVLEAHQNNRITVVDMRNPTNDEWINDFARDNNQHPVVMDFARETPQAFERYDNLTDPDNPYVFNPMRGQVSAFCTPRSLAKASHILFARGRAGAGLLPMLAGTVGEAAARDMENKLHMFDQLPRLAELLANPGKCPLPDGMGPYFVMAFSLASKASPDTIDPISEYVMRWKHDEAVALYANQISQGKRAVFACKSVMAVKVLSRVGKFFAS